MNTLARYAFYWLAATAVFAVLNRSRLGRSVPARAITAAANRHFHVPLALPAPKGHRAAGTARRRSRTKK